MVKLRFAHSGFLFEDGQLGLDEGYNQYPPVHFLLLVMQQYKLEIGNGGSIDRFEFIVLTN